MTIFLILIFELGNVLTAHAQERVYHPRPLKVEVHLESSQYTVQFKDEVGTVTQRPTTMPDLASDTSKLRDFFNQVIGEKMSENKAEQLNEAVKQLISIQNSASLGQTQLALLAADLVRALAASLAPSTENRSGFYEPYELLMIGPTTRTDKIVLLAGLLSALCFDIQLLVVDGQLSLAVRSGTEQTSETYEIDSAEYQIVTKYKRSGIGRMIDVDELCQDELAYKRPIDNIPTLVSADYANEHGHSLTRTGSRWEADMSDSVERLRELNLTKSASEAHVAALVFDGRAEDLRLAYAVEK